MLLRSKNEGFTTGIDIKLHRTINLVQQTLCWAPRPWERIGTDKIFHFSYPLNAKHFRCLYLSLNLILWLFLRKIRNKILSLDLAISMKSFWNGKWTIVSFILNFAYRWTLTILIQNCLFHKLPQLLKMNWSCLLIFQEVVSL